jgi:hypothetical protein
MCSIVVAVNVHLLGPRGDGAPIERTHKIRRTVNVMQGSDP